VFMVDGRSVDVVECRAIMVEAERLSRASVELAFFGATYVVRTSVACHKQPINIFILDKRNDHHPIFGANGSSACRLFTTQD
jgi:hypothetical protein